MILCQNNKDKSCNICKSCIELANNNNPDFYIIQPDGNSIKVELIRGIINKIIEKPIISSKKVYIISNSELMTKEAQNTLLKTLEEPAEYVTIILITQNENQILNTIRSRCIKIKFNNIDDNTLKEYLENSYKDIPSNLLKSFNGSIEKALNMLENKELYEKIDNIFLNIEKIEKADIINSNNIIYGLKEDIENVLDYINIIFYNKIIEDTSLKNRAHTYASCIDIINDAKQRLEGNSNFDMTIDNMLLSIWEEIHEKHSRS